jgi:hypothetical protein
MHPLTFISQSSRWGTPSSPVSCRRGRGNWASPLATTRTTMWKWEQGQEPDADAQRVLADLLHVPYEQLRGGRMAAVAAHMGSQLTSPTT